MSIRTGQAAEKEGKKEGKNHRRETFFVGRAKTRHQDDPTITWRAECHGRDYGTVVSSVLITVQMRRHVTTCLYRIRQNILEVMMADQVQ